MFDDPALTARGIFLQPTREEDTPFQRALFETARPDAVILAAWPDAVRRPFLDQQFQFQTLHYARVYPDADWLLVVGNGAPVGRLIVWRAPAEWRLVDIALLPAWRGQGLGTLLLQTIQAGARQAGAPCLRLMVDMQNPARRLYERLGFVTEEESIPAVSMRWQA